MQPREPDRQRQRRRARRGRARRRTSPGGRRQRRGTRPPPRRRRRTCRRRRLRAGSRAARACRRTRRLPRVSAASSTSFPAAVTAPAPFGERRDEDERRKPARRPRVGRLRGRAPAVEAADSASTARTSSATSAGPTAASVPATPTVALGRSRARRRQSTTVTRKMEKEGSPADRLSAPGSWLGMKTDYDRRRSPVRGGPVWEPLTRMRIAFLTGIWPPDVGGPATHGPDFSRFLVGRGHAVHVVTMGDGEPAERPCEVEVVSRRLPFPLRYGQVALLRHPRGARNADVVYATATYAAAAAASTLARRPLVAKLVSDPAYERAQRYGAFAGTLEEFQSSTLAVRASAEGPPDAVAANGADARRPERLSGRDRRGWGLSDRPHPRRHQPRAAVARTSSPSTLPPGTFVFVGRLTRQKALATAIEAVAAVPEARLVLVGDGPERARARTHCRRLGGRRADRVPRLPLARRRAANGRRRRGGAALERLGEPAPCRGRGALRRSPRGLHARRRSTRGRPRRRERAARRARPPRGARGGDPAPARGARSPRKAGCRRAALRRGDLERGGLRPARGSAGRGGVTNERPRVLFVGRMRHQLPLPGWLAKKWDAVEELLDYRILAGAEHGSPVRDGALPARRAHPAAAPWTGSSSTSACPCGCAVRFGDFRPAAIFASDPFVGRRRARGQHARRRQDARDRRGPRRLADLRAPLRLSGQAAVGVTRRPRCRVCRPQRGRDTCRLDVHRAPRRGGPRASAECRLHGFQRPLGVRRAAVDSASRTADGGLRRDRSRRTRTSSASLLRGGSSPTACPTLGWSSSAAARGSKSLTASSATFRTVSISHEWLEPEEVSAVLDDATTLVLPSWPEGLGRVVIEAFARG